MDSNTVPAALQGLTQPSPNVREFTLDDNDLERTCPLDNNRHHVSPTFDLGFLDRLPLEILFDVIVQLDLRSLTDFRRLNQRAMQVVNSLPQYAAIFAHIPDSLRGILSIETGSNISCEKLFDVLSAQKCENCDDFGGYIYILTCTRICYLCFTVQIKYLPVPVSKATWKFGLDQTSVARLPRMRSLPGYYSSHQHFCSDRVEFLDPDLAYHTGSELHGSVDEMKKYVMRSVNELFNAYGRRSAEEVAETCPMAPFTPPSILSKDDQGSNPWRFMAIVRAPWLNPSTKKAEWGFHCVGCQNLYGGWPLHCRRKYSVATFEEHIQQCGKIYNGKHYPNQAQRVMTTFPGSR